MTPRADQPQMATTTTILQDCLDPIEVLREIDCDIVIIEDNQEKLPLPLTQYLQHRVEREHLVCADYSIRGFHNWDNPGITFERKTPDDLANSLSQGRPKFYRLIKKMRQFEFRALLVECLRADIVAHNYRSDMQPQSILATLDALAVQCGLHVYWCGSPRGTAFQLDSIVRQYIRGIQKEAALAYGVSRTVLGRLAKEYREKKGKGNV